MLNASRYTAAFFWKEHPPASCLLFVQGHFNLQSGLSSIYAEFLCIFIYYHGYNYYPHIQGSKIYKTLHWQGILEPPNTVHKKFCKYNVCALLSGWQVPSSIFPRSSAHISKKINHWFTEQLFPNLYCQPTCSPLKPKTTFFNYLLDVSHQMPQTQSKMTMSKIHTHPNLPPVFSNSGVATQTTQL